MTILLISGSLNPQSNSRLLMRQAEADFKALGVETDWLDLRGFDLPMCDGDAAYNHPALPDLVKRIGSADAVLMGVPIYNFYANAALKNLIELTGRKAWENQVVGFLCAAGGKSSYMSVSSLGMELMLDFRSLIVPRFIYATYDDFTEQEGGALTIISSEDIKARIRRLCEETLQVMKGKVPRS